MKFSIKLALTAFAMFCLVAFWLHSESQHAKGVLPPEGATNLVTFLQLRPNATNILKFTNSGSIYFEIIGTAKQPGLSLPSGPPVYVFDASGTLIEWTGDIGDNLGFNAKWLGLKDATPVTIEAAKSFMIRKSENVR